jgi:hypothetical protein
MVTLHYITLVILAPFIATLVDLQVNMLEMYGFGRAITSMLKNSYPAVVFLLPLAVFSIPLAVVYHLVLRRGAASSSTSVFWWTMLLAAIYPLLGLLFAKLGHYVPHHAAWGGLAGGLVAWPIIYNIWKI